MKSTERGLWQNANTVVIHTHLLLTHQGAKEPRIVLWAEDVSKQRWLRISRQSGHWRIVYCVLRKQGVASKKSRSLVSVMSNKLVPPQLWQSNTISTRCGWASNRSVGGTTVVEEERPMTTRNFTGCCTAFGHPHPTNISSNSKRPQRTGPLVLSHLCIPAVLISSPEMKFRKKTQPSVSTGHTPSPFPDFLRYPGTKLPNVPHGPAVLVMDYVNGHTIGEQLWWLPQPSPVPSHISVRPGQVTEWKSSHGHCFSFALPTKRQRPCPPEFALRFPERRELTKSRNGQSSEMTQVS